MKDPHKAFNWITSLLEELGHPYLVVGGLAANVFGGKRPLNDIDLDVPNLALLEVAARAKPYVIFGPARYRDNEFDIELLSLRYAGQDIDLTGADDVSLFDHRIGQWRRVPTNLQDGEQHNVLGKVVGVMKREALIEYKQMIRRPTDLDDVRAMGG